VIFYWFLIPVGLLFVPWVLVRYVLTTKDTRSLLYAKHAGYLWAASGLWMASQILPNIPISPETDTFTMHMTGGVVAAVLSLYALKVYRIKLSEWWQLPVTVFLFASALGVLNELFEFLLEAVGVPGVWSGDEWWDLLANTVGAFLAYAVIVIFKLSDIKR
jgi:hypothetical protein